MTHFARLTVTALLLTAVPACASVTRVDADGPTYAAQAKISIKENKTGNQQVKVIIEHLAPPSKIDPTLKFYVVWFTADGAGTNKAGVIDYNERKRRGRMLATTPNNKFELSVTIEGDPRVTKPSDKVIVRRMITNF